MRYRFFIVTPAVDYLLVNEEVDLEKIVLWGESFGGYLAPRAAAFEHHLAACIANSGIYDFLGGGINGLGLTREQMLTIAEKDPETLNNKLYDVAKKSSEFRWKISQGMYVFGCSTPAEFAIAVEKYVMKGIAENIKCPTLVVDLMSITCNLISYW